MTTFELYAPAASTSTFVGGAVSEAERLHAAALLRQAYIDGRLTPQEYDCRVGAVYMSKNRVELDAAFVGISGLRADAPAATQSTTITPQANDATLLPALAHWSAFFTGFVGPAMFYAFAKKGTYLRQQAARSLNTQVSFLIAFIASGLIFGIIGWGFVRDLVVLAWFLTTLFGGLKARKGIDWEPSFLKRHGVHIAQER